MAKRVLISGYSGFIGTNLLPYLHLKFDLFGLSRGKNNVPAILKDIYEWEDLSIKCLQETDSVIHLAGKAHDIKNVSEAKEYFEVNTKLTKKLFDVFLQSTASTFIYMSSVKAAADTVDGILYEDVIPNPKTPYGQSKQKAEEYLLAQNLPESKRLFILRPCMIHGPGNKGNLNLLYKFVKKGIPYPLAGFNNQRSFLSVENLCFVINEIITRDDIRGGIYQVSDDGPLSTNTVVSVLASSLNVKPRLWKIPKSLIMFLAKAGDWLHLPLNSERLNKLTESYVVSNQKIKQALKKELPLIAIEGLKITANSFNKD
ncbi:MAG TPA: NAD-dependent epimerase/dehydratase family protein [Hanamia sp.]